jgi:hypothetical protein
MFRSLLFFVDMLLQIGFTIAGKVPQVHDKRQILLFGFYQPSKADSKAD